MTEMIVKSIPKIRSRHAVEAALRVGGPMKDRREPRGGSRNLHREYLEEAETELGCDFCGKSSSKVQRIAMDRGYDRLRGSDPVLWACPPCSEEEEHARLRALPETPSDGD